jgi:hypothetical protein
MLRLCGNFSVDPILISQSHVLDKFGFQVLWYSYTSNYVEHLMAVALMAQIMAYHMTDTFAIQSDSLNIIKLIKSVDIPLHFYSMVMRFTLSCNSWIKPGEFQLLHSFREAN